MFVHNLKSHCLSLIYTHPHQVSATVLAIISNDASAKALGHISFSLFHFDTLQTKDKFIHALPYTCSYFCYTDLNYNSITTQASNFLQSHTSPHYCLFLRTLSQEHLSLHIKQAYRNIITKTLFLAHTTLLWWTCFFWIPNYIKYYLVLIVLFVSLFPFQIYCSANKA